MANQEERVCQSCKEQFTIDASDFDFYKKIDVPPPTWCPQCRIIRRMMWCLDATTLYQVQCQAPGHDEMIFSNYHPDCGSPIYDSAYWRSDAWDPRDHGRDYDFGRTFFEQFADLVKAVPSPNLELINCVNCDYCTSAQDSKNCYLSTAAFGSENCVNCHSFLLSKECVDGDTILLSQKMMRSFSVDKSFNCSYATYCADLVNCDFMYDSVGCSDCFGCVGLRNKQYYIFNKPYSKADYKKERAKYDLGSYKTVSEVLEKHEAMIASLPKKYARIKNSPNCTGDNIENSKNCQFLFQGIQDNENVKYGFLAGKGTKDSYDFSGAGLKAAELYEAASVIESQRVYFCQRVNNSLDVYYSKMCYDSQYLFGCVGLRAKKYCILNKQYSKEEYFELLGKIKSHMNEMPYVNERGQVYKFGEFMPIEHSPVKFNEAWVHEYFPMNKEEAEARGCPWRDKGKPKHDATIQSEDLPDNVKETEGSILNEIIGCSHRGDCRHNCKTAFKITPEELRFYRDYNLALPRECPSCRYLSNIEKRYFTPYDLWERQCMCQSSEAKEKGSRFVNETKHFHGSGPCPNKFQTPYNPDAKDLIYCQDCYQSELIS